MDIINKTVDGTCKYPRHRHKRYEIMHYIKGCGVMWTEVGEFVFSPGTVIIMPPSLLHGSVSTDVFVNISIESDFDGIILLDRPVVISEECDSDGERLSRIIWENRYGNEAYLHSLCVTYARYLLQKIEIENEMSDCIRGIVTYISDNAFDPEIDVTGILKQSGFSEDYVRAAFRKETGKAPIAFLTERRIRHARYLIDVYKDTLSLAEISERCGYTDYVYFSKKFKAYVGVSPSQYKKS